MRLASSWSGGWGEGADFFCCGCLFGRIGTEYEGLSVLQTVRQTASDPTQALVFNYASEALNNSFFLSTLVRPSLPLLTPALTRATPPLQTPDATRIEPSSQSPLDPNHALAQALKASPLKSFASLVSHFSSHVAGLHPSSGAYIWLVVDGNSIGVVGTYAGGTVLVHERKQLLPGGANLRVLGETLPEAEKEVEAAKSEWVATEKEPKERKQESKEDGGSKLDLASALVAPPFRSMSSHFNAGKNIHPLLCLSVHPHCYLADYGVWGRDEYVKNWWKAVDWKAVEGNYEKYTEASRRT